MSKYLIKILAVCAFVVLLPLAIVATALGVTESSACTLNLFISGNVNANASAKVLIDGKESVKFTAVKNSQVELTFESEGYYFLGWFEGTKETFKPESDPISKDARFTYTIENINSNLTAVCLEKTYNITFKNYESLNGVFVYGQSLPQAPVGSESESTFIGWTLESESGIFNNATFSASSKDAFAVNITLEPVFSDEKIVTYFDVNDNVIETKHFNKEQFNSFKLKTAEELSAYITKGYTLAGFVSKDDGTMIDDAFIANLISKDFSTAPLNIKLVEEIATFKMNVKFHESSDVFKELECRIDVEGLTGADQFTRGGYSFAGIKVGDAIYKKVENDFVNSDGIALSSVIFDGATEGVAVWDFSVWSQENQEQINIPMTITSEAYDKDGEVIRVKGIKDGNKEVIFNNSKISSIGDQADKIQLEDKIVDVLLNYDSFENIDGEAVELKSIRVSLKGGMNAIVISDKDATYLDLARVINEGKWIDKDILITFIFA